MEDIKIGFIGLGNMGMPMAENLLKAGYSVHVYGRNPDTLKLICDLGAVKCDTPKVVGENSNIVITSLPNSNIIEEVALGTSGLIEGMRAGSLLIDMSSSEPSSTKKIAARIAEKGIAMIDAPVSGGPAGAAQATLSIMVGGSKSDYERSLPILKLLGEKIFHIGDIGAGAAMKAVNNVLYGTIFAATCEAVTLGVKAGIDVNTLLDVINVSSGKNYAADVKFRNWVLKRNFKPGFSTDLLNKDMKIALKMSEEQGVPLKVCGTAQHMIDVSHEKGFGALDHTAAIQILEEITGIEIK